MSEFLLSMHSSWNKFFKLSTLWMFYLFAYYIQIIYFLHCLSFYSPVQKIRFTENAIITNDNSWHSIQSNQEK